MRKIILILLFLSFGAAGYALEAPDLQQLVSDRDKLQTEFQQKNQELSELSVKIHELNTQIQSLKQSSGAGHQNS